MLLRPEDGCRVVRGPTLREDVKGEVDDGLTLLGGEKRAQACGYYAINAVRTPSTKKRANFIVCPDSLMGHSGSAADLEGPKDEGHPHFLAKNHWRLSLAA